MKRWEYKVIPAPRYLLPGESLQSVLNDFGYVGWELCITDDGRWIFKRRLYETNV